MMEEKKLKLIIDAFLPIFFFLPFLVLYLPSGINISESNLTYFGIKGASFFPFKLVYDYKVLKISNLVQVLVISTSMLYLFIFGKVLLLKKILVPFYILIILSLSSSIGSNEILTSIKRSFITFFPMFCILHYYANHKQPSKVFEIFKIYFIYFTSFLCLYSLIIHLFDNVGTFGFELNPNVMYMIKTQIGDLFFKIISHYSYDYGYLNISQKCGDIGFIKFYNLDFGQFYSCRNFNGIWLSRPSSLMANTIGFSQLLLFSLIILYDQYTKKRKNNSLLIMLIILIFFLWTFSRINIITLVLCTLLLSVSFKKYNKVVSISFISFILSLTIIIILFSSLVVDSDSLLSFDRFSIFTIISNNFNFYDFNGVGFGMSYENFLQALKNYLPAQKHLNIVSIPSSFFTVIVEIGLLGFIAFNLFWFLPIFNSNDENNNSKLIIVLIISILMSQLTDISLLRFHPISFFFAFLLGLISNINYRKIN